MTCLQGLQSVWGFDLASIRGGRTIGSGNLEFDFKIASFIKTNW
jgi:hypothetical protein